MRKLAIYGLSGAGKSTTCRAVLDACHARGLSAQVIKLAEPLYQLQADIYTLVGRTADAGQQDQQLLRALADHIRRLNPAFLVEDFLARVRDACNADVDVVVNDDLKDTTVDYPRLVAAGFVFWHVTCTDDVRSRRLRARADLTYIPETTTTWRFDRIKPDATLDNTEDNNTDHGTDAHDRLRADVEALLEGWWT